MSVRFQPHLYGVTSWIVRFGQKIVGRYPWAKLAHKHARRFIRELSRDAHDA